MLAKTLVASFLAWALTTQGEVWKVRREQAPLRGITAVTIKVQDLSADAARCGVTSQAIRSATAQTQAETKVIDAPLTAQLLSDGTFAAGLTADFAQRIQDSLRSLAQTFATKIKAANPSK